MNFPNDQDKRVADLENKLREIAHSVLNHREPIFLSSVIAEIRDWTSIMHVNIMIDIEEHYGIRFTSREVAGVKTFNELVTLVQGKIKG